MLSHVSAPARRPGRAAAAGAAATAHRTAGQGSCGKVLEACIAHAREYAALWFAPQWLKDDIAALDTDAGRGRGSA